MQTKRLFFGFEIVAPWPEELPKGRLLREEDRHLTIAFLGEEKLDQILTQIPKPSFSLGLGGMFDQAFFLPKRSPRVAAWHIKWFEGELESYQKQLVAWLKEKGFSLKEKEFLSHVTIARQPFSVADWKKAFQPLPLFLGNLQLYESLGKSRYKVCWSHPILPPFEEKEHTADIAFTIRGANLFELFLHAQLALSFHFPPLVRYISLEKVMHPEEMIEMLNRCIALADEKEGCPFKAVSYHGNMEEQEWEMIVDV